MNFGRAFTYVTEDPDWLKKLGIAMLVMLIPILGQIAVGGWSLEIMRRVINDEPEILPEWNDFGKYISNGFKELVIGLVYALPAILIYGCGLATIAGFGMVVSNSGGDASTSDAMGGAIAFTGLCTNCLLCLFILVAVLLIQPAIGNLAATGELSAAFRFAEVFGLLRAAMGPYVLSILLIALVAPIASSLGSIACGIGALFALAYSRAVSNHLFGQAYKIARASLSNTPVESTM